MTGIDRTVYYHAWNVRQYIEWKLDCELDKDQLLTRKVVSDNIDKVEAASSAMQRVMVTSILHTLFSAVILTGIVLYLKCKHEDVKQAKTTVVKKGCNVFFNLLFFIFFGIAIKLLNDNVNSIKFVEDTKCGDKFTNKLMNDVGKELNSARGLNIFALVMTTISMLMDLLLLVKGIQKWKSGSIGLPDADKIHRESDDEKYSKVEAEAQQNDGMKGELEPD